MFRDGDYDFTGDWYGWRLRGRLLISPHGDRITRERLEGIAFRLDLERRRPPKPVRQVVSLPARELFAGQA